MARGANCAQKSLVQKNGQSLGSVGSQRDVSCGGGGGRLKMQRVWLPLSLGQSEFARPHIMHANDTRAALARWEREVWKYCD